MNMVKTLVYTVYILYHIYYDLCASMYMLHFRLCKMQEKNLHRIGPQYVCMFQTENFWKYFDMFCVCYCYYGPPQIHKLYFPAFHNSAVEEIWVYAWWALHCHNY